MIVQCPSCASRYRIRDANIPASGGKIRCPSCSHSFVVYPEASDRSEDQDRTSITSEGQISKLMGQMDARQRQAMVEDSTQLASSAEIDKIRAMEALKQELGDPLEMDGTVEIQNPMKVWQEAQAALSSARAAAHEDDDIEDEYEEAATQIADPAELHNFPFRREDPGLVEQSDPTFMMSRKPVAEASSDVFGDSSPGLDPAGIGSGMHPYAQNTPPGGRNASPHSTGAATVPMQGVNGKAGGPPPMPPASTSGLTSAQLFEESEVEVEYDEATSPKAFESHPSGPPPVAAAAGPDPGHHGPWKLKTNFGLTYEFPDTRSLRSWLSSREELDGYQVSADDGDAYYTLDKFPQLDRSSGRQMMPSGNFSMPASHGSGLTQAPRLDSPPPSAASASGLNRAPAYQSGLHQEPQSTVTNANTTARGPRVSGEYKPPSRDSGYKGVLWFVFFLLLLVAVAIALQTFGVVDLVKLVKEDVLGQKPAVEAVQQPAQPANDGAAEQPPVDPAALEAEQEAEAQRLLKDARRLIEGNKLPQAMGKLETTANLVPDNPEVYELMADVHTRLGAADEAEKATAKAEELRAKQAPAASPDAGQPTE